MDLRLRDQRVLITGSSRGLGFAIAKAFVSEGAKVVLTGRDEQGLLNAEKKLNKPDSVISYCGDVHDAASLDDLSEFIRAEWGGIDHLVCNVGSGRSVPSLEEDILEWQRMLDINLLGAVSCVKAMQPFLMQSAEHIDGGSSITLIGSICGEEALGCPTAYAVAKSALHSYSNNMARSLAANKVRINTVTPGNLIFSGSAWEDKLASNAGAVQEMLDKEVPMKRLGKPEEVASVVAFLTSSCAAFVTGANWVVDGGQMRSY